jgi:3-oxoacyl-[acyl-carrier-protein] synthase II
MKSLNRRVAVTGMGMVTPIGVGKDSFGRALFQGDCGIGEIASFDTSCFPSHLGAEIKAFSPRDFISIKNLRRMDRLSQMVVASTRLALDDAAVSVTPVNRDRIGMILGSAFGPTDIKIHCAHILFTEGPGMINPILVPNAVMNAPAAHAAIELGFRGVNTTVNHQAASAETALIYAAMEIQKGAADIILAGGADILSSFFFETLVVYRAVSPADGNTEGARPFDKLRNGPVAGEGCAIVCLELLEHAQRRGVVPYCEMAGWGMSSAPAKPTDWPVNAKGVVLAMNRALKAADLAPKEIDMILAAGNGGKNPDEIESDGLLNIFGTKEGGSVVTSIKGALGESFSSGGIQAAVLALSIKEGKISPTLGLSAPISPLAFATGDAINRNVGHGLLNAVSHGGTNVSIVMGKIEEGANK